MADVSRLVAKWSSGHDYIVVQINGESEHAIYESIFLETDKTYKSQICKNDNKFW